jgi:hypothetical protein
MNNDLQKEKPNLILPVALGAVAAATIAYLYLTDDGADLREKIANNLKLIWKSIQNEIAISKEAMVVLTDKIEHAVSNGLKSVTEQDIKNVIAHG